MQIFYKWVVQRRDTINFHNFSKLKTFISHLTLRAQVHQTLVQHLCHYFLISNTHNLHSLFPIHKRFSLYLTTLSPSLIPFLSPSVSVYFSVSLYLSLCSSISLFLSSSLSLSLLPCSLSFYLVIKPAK